jgi:palmitoyltransferase
MEEIAGQGPQVVNGAPDMLGFLHKFRQLNENIEYCATKQMKVEIDVYPNDLPRELAERRVLMEHYEEQRKLLKFKDDVIWKLSQQLKQKYDQFQDEFDKETRHEMNEWARLVDRFANELKKYELVCAFCGQHLSPDNINAECVQNTPVVPVTGSNTYGSRSAPPPPAQDVLDEKLFFTDELPPAACLGQKKHFFAKPSVRGYSQNPYRTQTQSLLRTEVIAGNELAQYVLRTIYQKDSVQGVNLEAKFRERDALNTG